MADPRSPREPCMVGRYALFGELAHGGMATVHVGRLMGPAGFSRTVAIKRLHPNFAKDPEFVAMFMDEARLAARLHHPNVVSIIDVVALAGELLLVMEYVPGDSLSALVRAECRAKSHAEVPVVIKILCDVLNGLHCAHEARSERGIPLGIVHRDVSPQNVLVGTDGAAHLIDFGVAKAAGRLQSTRDGQIKGKIAYMAPEQIRNQGVDRRTDVYAAAVVLWEALAGRRLVSGDDGAMVYSVLEGKFEPPSRFNKSVPSSIDDIVMRSLDRDRSKRIQSALEMAELLEQAVSPASNMQVARWVERMAPSTLRERARLVAEVESVSQVLPDPRAAENPPVAVPVESTSGADNAVPASAASQTSEAIGSSAPPSPSPALEPVTQTSATLGQAKVLPGSRRSLGLKLFVTAGLALAVVVGYLAARVRLDRAQASGSATPSAAPCVDLSAAQSPSAAIPETTASAPGASQSDAAAAEADSGKHKTPGGVQTVVPAPPSKNKAKERYGF